MNFLFSTPINRLVYVGRLILTLAIALLAAFPFSLTSKIDPESSVVLMLAMIFSGLILLGELYYFTSFVVIARLRSAGMSSWHSLYLLLPFAALLIAWLTANDLWPVGNVISGSTVYLGLFGIFLLFLFYLLIVPENVFGRGSILQAILHDIEVGEGRLLIRVVPFLVVFVVIAAAYNLSIYRGLRDPQSMDNAQLARQIVRGSGFTTEFLRPHAVAQLHDYVISKSLLSGGSHDLFPADRFPPGAPRILPDTYNAPGYPVLLAGWFYLLHTKFDATPVEIQSHLFYPPDRLIPLFNQVFILLTAVLIFALGWRLFDDRVAWLALLAFVLSDMVWQYSLTGLSTCLLMFMVTGFLYAAVEIYCLSEARFESEESSFAPAWLWTFIMSLLLAAACLIRLPLLILLVPLLVFLALLPHRNFLLLPLLSIVVLSLVAPWFWHLYKVSGSFLGSNLPLLLTGTEGYDGNQIYCATSIPNFEQLFKDMTEKQLEGFCWHFEHAWDLLGSNPMVLLFGASILYSFKRGRAQVFRWLVVGCVLAIIAVNNLGETQPKTIDAWNVVPIFFPGILVIGASFFLILLDRLNLQVRLVVNLIVIITLLLTGYSMVLSVSGSFNRRYLYEPPYAPPYIKQFALLARPDEWITTDMPWATAWYGDRASLWLPDSISDFENLDDTVNTSGMLIFTPVTTEAPASTIFTGEYKDWLPFFTYTNFPPNFPLNSHIIPYATLGYSLWSDSPRWQR